MALKGQKFKKYSLEEKEKIIEKYNEGISSSYLEKKYGISNNTIRQWKHKLRKNGTLVNQKRGRISEKNLTKEDWKERYELKVIGNIQALSYKCVRVKWCMILRY